MIEQYTSPAVVNNSQEPWLVGEGVSLSGSIAIPSLDFNFVTNAFPGTVTFTRASTATYFDSAGVLQSAAIDVPRLDYDPATLLPRGFLVEEQRTNSIRNNTMQGAVAGTPGTLPTNWSVDAAAGLTTNVIGTGTSGGITYIDVQITGTATSTTYILVPEQSTQIAGANGQTWTMSAWWSVVGGTLTNVTAYFFDVREVDSGGVQLTSGQIIVAAPTATFTRITATRTLNQATTAFAQPRFRFTVTNGAAVDFTLRIGLPQLELGAFATSVIPTTTTALTRSADVAAVNTLSPWFNATEGTLYAEASRFGTNAGGIIRFLQFANSANRFRLSDSGGARFSVYATTTQADLIPTGGAFIKQPPNIVKSAGTYKTDDVAAVANGNTVASAAPPNIVPTGIDTATIGVDGSVLTTMWNGWIRHITYYPRRLSNAELQAITA